MPTSADQKSTLAMKTPPIVSPKEWEAAREQLLVKEKALTRTRDALAAERRRMPWMARPAMYPGLKKSAVDDQLAAALE